MTTTEDGIVRYSCTRIGLIDTFRELPLTRSLHLYALGRLVDSVLAGLPEVPADVLTGGGLYRAVNDAVATAVTAERERCARLLETAATRQPDHALPDEGTRWTAVTAADAIRYSYRHGASLIREQP